MTEMMVRACHKCKVYMCILPEDTNNLRLLHSFDADHARHMVQTVSLAEVRGIYKEMPCMPPTPVRDLPGWVQIKG